MKIKVVSEERISKTSKGTGEEIINVRKRVELLGESGQSYVSELEFGKSNLMYAVCRIFWRIR